MEKHLLSFGHGYSAQALGRRLIPQGWSITGTSRSAENLPAIAAQGAKPKLWPGDDLSADISTASHILTSAAPTETGDPVLAGFSDQIKAAAPHLKWVGYLSTTGVYGDHQGGKVDEETPLSPSVKRGNMRAKAEAEWQKLAAEAGFPLYIFRIAGIYGPGRGPFAKVRNGTARCIIKKNQFFSRIHVEDIANILATSIANPFKGGRIYNVCDDQPAPPEDVIRQAAKMLEMPIPPDEAFETADMHPMARSFYSESRKVSNARIKNELGVKLLYPTYHAGLTAILEAEQG
ncbi:MAG TPA: NAD(P)-dependent oxidoreductase [Rhodobacteraceae bacterium]|jgi:nucleoside-diphosphate-sugar epimerase|nr:NAD(P)-dependent oxidoreductase [Paracoccaceae bacterium]